MYKVPSKYTFGNFFESFYDETLPNFINRKHPRKGEKKKQMARTPSPSKQTAQKMHATLR